MSAPRTPQCEAVRAALAAGPLPPELQAHAEACPDCHPELAVHAALSQLRPPPPNEALQRAQTLAHAALRQQPRARAWWWSALGLVGVNVGVGVASAVMLLNQRVSTHDRPAPTAVLWAIAVL